MGKRGPKPSIHIVKVTLLRLDDEANDVVEKAKKETNKSYAQLYRDIIKEWGILKEAQNDER